jgi:hypothetical protein
VMTQNLNAERRKDESGVAARSPRQSRHRRHRA